MFDETDSEDSAVEVTITLDQLIGVLEAHLTLPLYRGSVRGFESNCSCGHIGPSRTMEVHGDMARQASVRDGYFHIWREIRKVIDETEKQKDE